MDSVREQLQKTLDSTYRLDRELGGGGMSRVFLSTELALNRQVVLKVLPDELADGVSAERFKREISVAARLQHAHIVPLLAAGDANGRPWFAMPFVEGETLRARLSRGELPIADAVRIMRDVATALAYAHAKGVVHRDIKPENILVADGSALVTDFGVAKALADAGAERGHTLTSVGVALGTPAYMAPEQAAADERTDHRADIYALGVVAYEMIAGYNPFTGRSAQATLAAHMTETPRPLDAVRSATPPVLAELIARCLAKSAADRPQTAQDVVQSLDTLVTPTGTAPLTAASNVAFPRARGRRGLLGAAVVAGAIAIAAAAWLALRTRTPDFDPHKVAVVPFENLTGDTTLGIVGRIAAEELARSITQTDSVDVISNDAVEAALAQKGGDVADRVAHATRAAFIVTGSYTKRGDSISVQATVVDARTNKIVRAIDPSTGPVSDPMIAIGGLRERLLGSIVSGDLARKVTIGSPPPRYAAWQEYEAGAREFMRDQAASRQYFERAIAIDPSFVAPYHTLATTYTNTGLWDEADKVTARLEKLRDRLSSFDRQQLTYIEVQNTGDAPEILRLSKELLARGADPLFAFLAGYWALELANPHTALALLRTSHARMTQRGWFGQARDEAQAYHLLGDYRAELAALDSGTKVTPIGAAGYRNSRLRAFAGLNDTTAAYALADTLLQRQTPQTLRTTLEAVLLAASEFDAHGDSTAGSRFAQMVTRWSSAHPAVDSSVAAQRIVGTGWFIQGGLDSAEAHLARAAIDTSLNGIAVAGYRAIIAARKGNAVRARAISDSLGANMRKWDRGTTPFWQAAILAQLGDREQAIQLLTGAPRKGRGMRDWHSHPALRTLRGYPAFESLIHPQ